MNKIVFSCKGCEKRYPGCHAQCETYKAEKAALDERKEQMRKHIAINRGITSQRFDTFYKVTKHQHYRSKFRKGK